MLAERIQAVNIPSDTEDRLRSDDATLPPIGTDLITLRVVMRNVDPTLPRIGTDLIATASRDAQGVDPYLIAIKRSWPCWASLPE